MQKFMIAQTALLSTFVVTPSNHVHLQENNSIVNISLPTKSPQRVSKVIEKKITPNGNEIEFMTSTSNSDIAKEELVNQIKTVFDREIKYNIRLDEDLDVYFFDVYSSMDRIDDDFKKVKNTDKVLMDSTYNGKKIIVTLVDEDVWFSWFFRGI